MTAVLQDTTQFTFLQIHNDLVKKKHFGKSVVENYNNIETRLI